MNTPEIWYHADRRTQSLVEPMIAHFQKFNSNSGWVGDSGDSWCQAMQALSHFSFHDSDGSYLLCDLQGGVYSDGW